jgi:hypothetical protein
MLSKPEVLKAIYKKRGYLVLWQAPYHPPFTIGRIVRELGGEGVCSLGLFRVRARTSKADFMTQQVLSRKIEPAHWKHGSPTGFVNSMRHQEMLYWRVTRTTRDCGKGPIPSGQSSET